MYAFQIKNFLDTKIGEDFFVTPVDLLPRDFNLPMGCVINLSESGDVGIKLWHKTTIRQRFKCCELEESVDIIFRDLDREEMFRQK